METSKSNKERDLDFEREKKVTKPIIPYSSIQIYANVPEFMYSLKCLLSSCESSRQKVLHQIETVFEKSQGMPAGVLPTLSVRTAWSLLLQVLNLPKGSEVLMTSINIPDMVQIVREHGLIPIPVDIDLNTTAPTLEDVKSVTSSKSKVFMVSYIYGVKYNIDDIIKFCKEKGILIVEDIAESYTGPKYTGNPDAIMSLFSFGSIKRFTAFGGALSFIRNPEIFKKMETIHNSYPSQTKKEFYKKILKAGAMGLCLNNQATNYAIKFASRIIYFNYKEMVVKALRGFKPQKEFLAKFRKKPSVALLKFLNYRLRNFDEATFLATNQKLQRAINSFLEKGIKTPGYSYTDRSFWLFPVCVPDLELCSELLNKRGVDAYLGATQLKKVYPPKGSSYKPPTRMYGFFDQILYMPISELVPEDVIKKMIDEIAVVCKIVEAHLAKTEPSTKL